MCDGEEYRPSITYEDVKRMVRKGARAYEKRVKNGVHAFEEN